MQPSAYKSKWRSSEPSADRPGTAPGIWDCPTGSRTVGRHGYSPSNLQRDGQRGWCWAAKDIESERAVAEQYSVRLLTGPWRPAYQQERVRAPDSGDNASAFERETIQRRQILGQRTSGSVVGSAGAAQRLRDNVPCVQGPIVEIVTWYL